MIASIVKGCRCLHFQGTGYPEYLAVEDSKQIGQTHLVHYALLRKIHEDEDQKPEFVFAIGAHSEYVAEAFIEAYVPHVVAVKSFPGAPDEAASVFIKYFYNALLNGVTVAKSFKVARRAAIAMTARLNHDKFKLLPENDDHKVSIFCKMQTGAFVNGSLKHPINNLPERVPHFIGRDIDMRNIINQMMEPSTKRLVLVGDTGIGKTATAIMIGRYLYDRRMFRGGIFFMDVRKLNLECKSLSSMLLKVFEECGVINKQKKEQNVFWIIRRLEEHILLIIDGIEEFDQVNTFPRKGCPNGSMFEREIEYSITSFLENIYEKCSWNVKIIITCSKPKQLGIFENDMTRYYMIRKLKPRGAAKLFSRVCNDFCYRDVLSNQDLMEILQYNPKQIIHVVSIKHQYECSTLEQVVKAYKNET